MGNLVSDLLTAYRIILSCQVLYLLQGFCPAEARLAVARLERRWLSHPVFERIESWSARRDR